MNKSIISSKRVLVTAIFGIDFEYGIEDDIEIFPNVFLVEYNPRIKELLGKDFVKMVGHIENEFLVKSPAVIYSECDCKDKNKSPQPEVSRFLDRVKGFNFCLWAIKDNAANSEIAYASWNSNGVHAVDSKFSGAIYTMAAAKSEIVKFSEKELFDAIEFSKKFAPSDEFIEWSTTALIKKRPRLVIFLYHIQGARCMTDVAIKISQYCIALESLFSSTNSELSHQLAERVAFFLETKPEKRLSMYKLLKRAYSYRSKVAHGSLIKNSELDNLILVSQELDDVLRSITKKVLYNDSLFKLFGGKGDLDDYFLELIFGLKKQN